MARRSHLPTSARFRKPPPDPQPDPTAQQPAQDDGYTACRLARIRAQLDLVDARITEEADRKTADGQRLNWLASAQERLAEQERILAGRPLPGSRRPLPDRPDRSTRGIVTCDPLPVIEPSVEPSVGSVTRFPEVMPAPSPTEPPIRLPGDVTP